MCAEHLTTGEGLLAVSGKWVADFLLNEDQNFLDLDLAGGSGKEGRIGLSC